MMINRINILNIGPIFFDFIYNMQLYEIEKFIFYYDDTC